MNDIKIIEIQIKNLEQNLIDILYDINKRLNILEDEIHNIEKK